MAWLPLRVRSDGGGASEVERKVVEDFLELDAVRRRWLLLSEDGFGNLSQIALSDLHREFDVWRRIAVPRAVIASGGELRWRLIGDGWIYGLPAC